MKKEEALKLIRAFFEAHEMPASAVDNANTYFQMMLGTSIIAFNFREETGELTASSLIYQFHDAPKPKVAKAIEAEAAKEKRAEIKYDAETKNLYAAKIYENPIKEAAFVKDVETITKTASDWSTEILDRIASQAFQPEKL